MALIRSALIEMPFSGIYVASLIAHSSTLLAGMGMSIFVILIAIKHEAARTIVNHLIERVFSVFGPPEMLRSDQGSEFDNELVKDLQSFFGSMKHAFSCFKNNLCVPGQDIFRHAFLLSYLGCRLELMQVFFVLA